MNYVVVLIRTEEPEILEVVGPFTSRDFANAVAQEDMRAHPKEDRYPVVMELHRVNAAVAKTINQMEPGTPEQREQGAYGRWKGGSRADDPARKAAFDRGCICHFLEGDFHHGIGCLVKLLTPTGG